MFRITATTVLAFVVLLAACGGGGAGAASPIVEQIPDAVAAIEAHYGAPQEFFEIAARLDSVTFVVAVDGASAAEQGSWTAEGGLVGPEPAGEASGATFAAAQIDVDPEVIFDRIRDELDDPVILDFAVLGGQDGTVIYDATVASGSGGLLRVFLGPEGQIQGVQAQ